MAFLNGLYIFVEDEQYTSDMEVSQHSVEKNIPTTDTVMQKARELNITGAIVDYENTRYYGYEIKNKLKGLPNSTMKAARVLSEIEALKNSGALITYNGRRQESNMQIVSFSTGHNSSIMGGATFDMTLRECRIVSNAYVDPNAKETGQQQVDKGENEKVYYTTKKGDTVWNLVWTKRDGKTPADYRNLKREGAKSGAWGQCNWVMENNPHAFSKKGVFESLQINKKLFLGVRA